MRRYRVWVCLVMWLGFTFAASGADKSQKGAKKENDELLAVWFTSYDCPAFDDKSKPGSTRNNPIETDIPDIAYEYEKFDCRWVKIQGYPRSLNYYHYRDLLFSSVADHHFLHSKLGPRRLIVENYAPGAPSHWEQQGAQLELVGQFYNLCAAAERIQKERKEHWWIFGPCHYGDDYGMMLKDVGIVRQLTPAYQRVTGESNRALIGTLVEAPRDWPDRKKIRNMSFDWLRAARKGRRALEEFVHGPDAHARAAKKPDSEMAQLLRDPDSRIAFLTTSPKSPLRRLRGSPEHIPFRIFLPFDFSDWENGRGEAYGCFCLHRTCKDVWPLFEEDPEDMLNDYVCAEHRIGKDKWEVQW